MAARATPRWWRIRPWQGAVIALGLWCKVATAQPRGPAADEDDEVERPVVAVINLREGADAKALSDAIAAQITATPELAAIADSRVSLSLTDPLEDEETQAIEGARDKLLLAHEKMGELDLRTATELADAGQRDLKMVAPGRITTELLADLAFAEGQARFARRDQDRTEIARAKVAFAWVHRLSPGRKLDPDAYLDDLIAVFDAAANAKATATFEIIEADGTIWVDGQEQPAGTLTIKVPAGRHWIVSTGPDQQPSGEFYNLVDGQHAKVDLPRRTPTGPVQAMRARRALVAAPDPTARAGAMATIQRITGIAAAVIVTSDEDGRLAVQLWRNKAPGFGEIRTAKQPWSSEAERSLEPLLPKKKIIDKPKNPFDNGLGPLGPNDEGEQPWYRKRWVQVTIVAGVIGVIAGSIAISNAAGASERPCCGDVIEMRPGAVRQ